jgi:hypothetical protein
MKILIYTIFIGMMATPSNSDGDWKNLLDNDLSQWENFLSYRHKDGYNGKIPTAENGQNLAPVGYNKDHGNVFSVIQQGGEPVLRVSGEVYGCVYTKEEFENYHLTMYVKWGQRKDVPRLNKLRDSGILYHSIGEAGVDYWRSWMLSQEFQIMEGHMGDYWNIANSAIEIRSFLSEGRMNSVASEKQPFLLFGTGSSEGFCLRSEDYESAPGEWTKLDLICFNDKSVRLVNGHVVMVLRNSHYVKDGRKIPLTKGKIQLQSEAAECFFKDIKIRSLASMPAEYAGLFKD